MTQTATPVAAPAGARRRRPGGGGSLARFGAWWRRWHRMVIPLGLAVTLFLLTVIAHAIQAVDVTDTDYLSPTSNAAIGGADLAGRLTAAGVTVRRITNSDEMLTAGYTGDVTIFIPAPSLIRPATLHDIRSMAASTRVVLIAPSDTVLADMGFKGIDVRTRWAAATVAPGCAFGPAAAAGTAGVDGREYAGAGLGVDCYRGSLVQLPQVLPQLLLAGASEPFRNDRFGEAGNAALATGLLDTGSTVVWLDLHQAEHPPPRITGPASNAPTDTDAPPVGDGGSGGGGGGGAGAGGGGGGGGGGGAGAAKNSVADLFPSWLWALVGLVALIGLALAVAGARRLGPPIPEPLPVAARGRESVEGRGRLYRAAHQPEAALRVLRNAALAQLPGLLGRPPGTRTRDLVIAAAEHTSWPEDTVAAILVDDLPGNHRQLLAATRRLDELMYALHQPPSPRESPHPREGEHR